MAKNSSQKLNVPMILISAVAAAVAWPLIHGLKGILLGLGRPLAVSMISTLFLTAMSLVVILFSKLLGTYRADVVTGERKKTKFMLTMLISVLVCLGLMLGFEWLYERNLQSKVIDTGTYIFVVDDSGSTLDTDPDQARYRALQSIMKEKDADDQYAIYAFADGVTLLQPMQKVSDGIPTVQGESNGGTSIKAALQQVIQYYEQGLWEAPGGVQVILITDGYATDIGFLFEINSVLKLYEKYSIPVSAVGLGNVDVKLLTHIADKTGGQFIDIVDVDQLNEALKSAAVVSAAKRDLFSDRPGNAGSWLYGFMRILFLGVLGVMISAAEAFAYGNSSTFWFIIVMGAIKGVAASAFMELGICALGLPAGIVCWIGMTLMGTVVARFSEKAGYREKARGQSRRIDFED
jgi:uncharacterized protein YegL